VNQAFGQGISVRGIEGSRTPLFAELPDVSAYFATDHTFQHPGKRRLRYFRLTVDAIDRLRHRMLEN
jgi:hypothetical protein